MTIDSNEIEERIKAISNGPWEAGYLQSIDNIGPAEELKVNWKVDEELSLDEIDLQQANKLKNERLKKMLRLHYDHDEGVTDENEIAQRNAFDQALIIPQLYELAIETGYLTTEQLLDRARALLVTFLWSSASRKYIQGYDFIAVQLLASRIGIAGITTALPPEPDSSSIMCFAGFLAHMRSFYADNDITTWTGFLDDFVEGWDEQEHFRAYLNGEGEAPKRAPMLLLGCQKFVDSLASAFESVDEKDLGKFGLVHLYWLQKFFCYEKRRNGFVKNVELWGTRDSWANSFLVGLDHLTSGLESELAAVFKKKYREQVHLLGKTFFAVMQALENSDE